MTAYGSTLLSRSCAKSRVVVSPRRDAYCQFANSGMNAIASTGEASSHPRRVGVRIVVEDDERESG
jgi:hypothetical protein